MLVACVGVDVRLALVLQTVYEGGGFILICENDTVALCKSMEVGSCRFLALWPFSRSISLRCTRTRVLVPLLVLKIDLCFPDFPLEAVRCSLVGCFSGSS